MPATSRLAAAVREIAPRYSPSVMLRMAPSPARGEGNKPALALLDVPEERRRVEDAADIVAVARRHEELAEIVWKLPTSNWRFWMASTIFFFSSTEPDSANCVRSASVSGSLAQPTQARSPAPDIANCTTGSSTSAPSHQVKNMFQPPWSTGLRLVRRCSTVAQSIAWASTFMPMRFSVSATTVASAD